MHPKRCFLAVGFCIRTILTSHLNLAWKALVSLTTWAGVTRVGCISHQSKRDVLILPRIAQNNNNVLGCQVTDALCENFAGFICLCFANWLRFVNSKLDNMFCGAGCTRSFIPCTPHVGKHPERNLEATFYIFQGHIFPAVYSLRPKFSVFCYHNLTITRHWKSQLCDIKF